MPEASEGGEALSGPAARAFALAWSAFARRFPEGGAAPERYKIVLDPDVRGGFRVSFIVPARPGEPYRRGYRQEGLPQVAYAIDAKGELTGPFRMR